MPSESKPLLTAQTEKPNHYSYLKEFRVEQCPSFLQHKCTQHRPFTCFHWHFMNQRRRRPVRKRDGSFNYSADNYCTKYDETTGVCPEGDECTFLHRTAGDTERRYHLRYYKTCMCVHDTDSRGYCVKNGPHCAFAHGNHDLRPPVYDIKELQALENPENDANGASSNGPNVLDKERNLMNEDPKWQDTNYVLSSYKTEACKRPPRLCRQGYACPQYHNSKDKRRSPRKYKYRSTPCPNVKHGEEWGEPGNCDSGDQCQYCHTRTEQQFHPEIYKSTKCNDVQQAGYCPRGVFCAFAHVELGCVAEEMSLARELNVPLDCGTNLADILSNALPQTMLGLDKKDKAGSDSSNGSGEVSESASTSSLGSNSSHSKAPGAQLSHGQNKNLSNMLAYATQMQFGLCGPEYNSEIAKQMLSLDNESMLGPLDKEQKRLCLNYGLGGRGMSINNSFDNTVESVVGNALDELNLEDPLNLVCSMDKELKDQDISVSNSISAGLASSGLLGTSAPVNIPGSTMAERASLANFSPTSSPLQPLQTGFLSSRYTHEMDNFLNTHISSSNKIGNSFNNSLFDFSTTNMSPGRNHNSFSMSPSMSELNRSGAGEISRLRDELNTATAQKLAWEDRVIQARTACEAWQRETEEATRKANIAEQQRDEAVGRMAQLKMDLEQLQRSGSGFIHGMPRHELRALTLPKLKALQAQLRADLEEVEKVLYVETAAKCMKCEEQNRSVTLAPCNHYVLCDGCASTQKECPYCQTPVIAQL